jgi:hypothetical protein
MYPAYTRRQFLLSKRPQYTYIVYEIGGSTMYSTGRKLRLRPCLYKKERELRSSNIYSAARVKRTKTGIQPNYYQLFYLFSF